MRFINLVKPLLLLVLAIEYGWGQLTWTRLSQNGTKPAVRADMGYGYDPKNNLFYMFGGRGGAYFNDLWTYNLSSYEWNQITLTTPDNNASTPNQRFSVVSGYYAQGEMFLVSSGEGNGKTFFNDVWAFTREATSERSPGWEQLPSNGSLPEVRYGAAGGIHPDGSSLYLTHGFSNRRYSNTFRYDLASMEWVEVFGGASEYSATEPHARCLVGHAMAGPESPVFYGGCLSGGFTGGPCPGSDSWVLRDGKWSRLGDCAAAKLYAGMAEWPGSSGGVVLFGGLETDRAIIRNDPSEPNEIDYVDTNTGNWKRLATGGDVPRSRYSHAMVAVRDGVLIFGGSPTDTKPRAFLNDMWLLTGNPDNAPTAGSCGPRWFLYLHLHGFFMIISWGILLIAGVFIARYFRHKNPTWFKLHQGLQIAGASLSLLGIILVFPGTRAVPNFAHSVIGALILIFSIQQVINGLRRPHKEKDQEPTKKRVHWEYWHMWGGRLFLLLGAINISLGVYLALAPSSVIAVWFVMFAAWIIAFVVMEIRLQLQRQGKGA